MAKSILSQPQGRKLRSYEKRRLLRPYRSSELTDLGTQIYRQIAKMVLPVTLGPMMLCAAALIFFQTFVLPSVFLTKAGSSVGTQFTEVAFALVVLIVVGGPLLILGLGYASGPVIRLSSQVMMGDSVDPAQLKKDGGQVAKTMAWVIARVLLHAFWLPILSLLLVGVSAMVTTLEGESSSIATAVTAFAVLGLVVAVFVVPLLLQRIAIAPAVALLEGVGPKEAMERSRALTRPGRGQASTTSVVSSLFFTSAILYFVVSGGVSMLLGILGIPDFVANWSALGIWAEAAKSLVEATPFVVTLWIMLPLWGCVTTALYFDRRVRMEGLDIQVLAEDVLHADRAKALLN